MTATLKLYPPPQGGRWVVRTIHCRDGLFCRVSLIIREKRFFGAENEVGYEDVSTLKTVERKRIKNANGGCLQIEKYAPSTAPRTEVEMDKAIWEASREIVRKYNRDRRPHEYITEWENA